MKQIFLTIILSAYMLGAWAQTEDKTIVITSDWHLSDVRSFDPDNYYAWTDKNQERIVSYLQQLMKDKDNWDVLVLNGDIFEFWRSPVNMYMVADDQGNVLNDVQYLLRIKERNATIFACLDELRKAGKELVFMPGNHDLTVSQEDVEAAFPGLFTCAYDTKGTGLYEPFGELSPVAIEHGNRYEYFASPYQHEVFGTEGVETSSLLPPGYFGAKIGASSTVYKTAMNKIKAKTVYKHTTAENETDAGNRTFLAAVWNAIRAAAPCSSYTVKTRIDGVGTAQKDSCTWSDYSVSETNDSKLFKDSWTVANWTKRQQLNGVPVYVSFPESMVCSELHDYLDEFAFQQRLDNASKPTLICVFGHSHEKRLLTRQDPVKGDVIYLNEGAWVDNTKVCTYGVIRYKASTHCYAVELRQFDADGSDCMLDCRYLYVPQNCATKQTDGSIRFNAKAVLVDNNVTGIENTVTPSTAKKHPGYYNLQGQGLQHPSKGINIINGRKVLK